MNVPQLDLTDYNRFLASVGLVLMAAALLVPWVVLKDISVLEIPASKINVLTSDGASSIRQAQDRYRLFACVYPFVSVPVFLLGATMFIKGLLRIRALQPHHEAALIARGMRAQRAIDEQTLDEAVAKASFEVATNAAEARTAVDKAAQDDDNPAALIPEDGDAARGHAEASEVRDQQESDEATSTATNESDEAPVISEATPPPNPELVAAVRRSEQKSGRFNRVLRVMFLKSRVLSRIGAIVPADRELSRRPRVEASGEAFEPDAVISSPDWSKPDVLVDIMVGSSSEVAGRSIDANRGRLERYRELVDSQARSWQVVIVEESKATNREGGGVAPPVKVPESDVRDLVAQLERVRARHRGRDYEISVVRESQINLLRFPRGLI